MSAPEGLLLLDKPGGVTSHDVVSMVRRALDTRKVGHAGTLDPMATGLLLVGVGRATRLLRYLSGLDKTYEGTGKLGVETDTLDAEGAVTRTAPVPTDLDAARLSAAMGELTGSIEQIPPQYSAVKVDGQTMHKAARRGETIEAPPREVHIASFDLEAWRADEASFDFLVSCSGGTYVRTLVADLGEALGTGAHLTRLRRTRIGPFGVADAHAPDSISSQALRPVEAAVEHLPRLELPQPEADAAANGRPLGPAGVDGPYGVYDPQGRLIGMYVDRNAKAVPEMILAPPGE